MANLTLKCMEIADYIIHKINIYNENRPFRENVLLSARRLQKLLYFWETEYMIKNNGKPLFEDEFYAWPSGPVIEKIYYVYIQDQKGKMNPYHKYDELNLSNDIKCMVDKILEVTKDLDTSELIKISKVIDGPHSKAFVEEDKNHGQIVSKEDTYLYYSKYKSIQQFIPQILKFIEQENEVVETQKNEEEFVLKKVKK